MIDLKKEIQFIKGVGPSRAKLLNRLGIFTLEDLITYFPRTHEDRSKPKYINELIDGEEALISAFPVSKMSEIKIRRNLSLCKLVVRDETGTCTMTWYNQGYLRGYFKTGERYKFYGKVTVKNGKPDMNSPVFDKNEVDKNTGKIIPIYPLTMNLSQVNLRKIIEAGLSEIKGKMPETIPEYLLNKYHLCDINTAIESYDIPLLNTRYSFQRKSELDGCENTYWNIYQYNNHQKNLLHPQLRIEN